MFNAIDVANYIVHRAIENQTPITHLKLQKILYYVAAGYYQQVGERLFPEPICKWSYGPVVENVYHLFRIYGSYAIHDIVYYTFGNENQNERIEYQKIKEINDKVGSTIDRIIGKYLMYSAFDLVEMTHREYAWNRYRADIMSNLDVEPYTDAELEKAYVV